jgi:phytoene dehydrogenase-like protein
MLYIQGTQQGFAMQHAAEQTDLSAPRPGSAELEQALKSLDALRASLQTVVASPASDNIPVLHDIVEPGTPQPVNSPDTDREQALDKLLDALREELDLLIEDMISDARKRFELLLAQSGDELKTAVRGRLETHITDYLSTR